MAAGTEDPRDAAARLIADHGDAWVAQLAGELDRRLSGRRVERLARQWRLSRMELGALFGVSRQAVSKWTANGVPAERARQVADVEAITDLLEHHLEHDRIAAVVRRQAPGLGGMSVLELVASGQSDTALQFTRRMFTFGDAHA